MLLINRKNSIPTYFLILGVCLICLSCKKLVDVPAPVTGITSASAYNNDITAAAVMTGVYANMSNSSPAAGGLIGTSLYPSLSADELSIYGSSSPLYVAYYTNALTNNNMGVYDIWSQTYPLIYITNSVIEGVTDNNLLTPAIKQQLLGEATFMRALAYFYLVNLYGAVPLLTTTDYKSNALLARAASNKIYEQIIKDLRIAQSSLSAQFLDATLTKITSNRVRPTYWAATALLARTYLYTGKWDSAEAQASLVIGNSSLFGIPIPDSAFLINNREAIWQLQLVGSTNAVPTEQLFAIPSTGPTPTSFYLSPFLLNAFENGDKRRTKWIDSVIAGGSTYYYPGKYKSKLTSDPLKEYSMVLRLAEQFLIRAEARAQQGNTSGAATDLNLIRTRAGLLNTTAATQADLLAAIYHERQVELFTEWGNRWMDLKRSGKVDSIMTSVCSQKGGSWSSNWQLYPVPLSELKLDQNLVQNKGY